MINEEQLREIGRLSRLRIHQQEKHYLQCLTLNSIYSVVSTELIFKGGTALFLFYRLPRFSDDLDFTCIRNINFERLVNKIMKDLELFGVPNHIDKFKKSKESFSFRINAEGPLFKDEKTRCFIRIKISLRESVKSYEVKELSHIYPDLPIFSVPVMSREEILAEKVRAIMTRNFARDLFDLWFLVKNKVKININLVNEKLAYYRKEFSASKFKEKINEKKEIWDSELKPLVMTKLPVFNEVKKEVLNAFKK